MILPSSRSLTACPHDGQRPVSPVLISRWVPRPDGGANGFPGTAGGHAATGVPGHAVASAITSLPGLPLAGGCRPSQAGRKILELLECVVAVDVPLEAPADRAPEIVFDVPADDEDRALESCANRIEDRIVDEHLARRPDRFGLVVIANARRR